MFNRKTKAEKVAEALRADGYRVLTTQYAQQTVLTAEKGNLQHLAKYQGRKLVSFESRTKHQWYDVISYQPINSNQYVKDFK